MLKVSGLCFNSIVICRAMSLLTIINKLGGVF